MCSRTAATLSKLKLRMQTLKPLGRPSAKSDPAADTSSFSSSSLAPQNLGAP
jgi:hypothetical protein